MKNNRAFTLVEMILVVVLIGIVTIVALPNIFNATNESKKEKYKNIEENLKNALELYNIDNEEDLWTGNTTYNVTLNDLKKSNKKIDPLTCDVNLLQIEKITERVYDYKVCITCGDDYKSTESYCS